MTEDLGPVDRAQSTVRRASSCARSLTRAVKQEDRLGFARAMVAGVISAHWQEMQRASGRNRPLRQLPADIKLSLLPEEAIVLTGSIGDAAANLDIVDASYAIGVLYTALMPTGQRAGLGAYYTPPALCDRLLDMAQEAGVDWCSARVLDPACGGGAFLSPVARRMADSLKCHDAKFALKDIQRRLKGFELDPFAAWMSQVFLDMTLDDLCHEAGMCISQIVRVCDSLKQHETGDGFHLVVGNPPYGRTKLSPELRRRFRGSLFGHANLYGVFTDLALRFAKEDGVIAYVTPTSFLAGEYFKALRGMLGRQAPPVSIEFIAERKGVFADVLQETLLATYRRGSSSCTGQTHFISHGRDGSVARTAAGPFKLPADPSQPWLMPRTRTQGALVHRMGELPCRLSDYGYTVSTGPLVWNRHKQSLRDRPGKGRFPLIWAESVRPDGVFSFRAERPNHKPYFEPKSNENWVVTKFPCVLLQRTTAKEQSRRLIAAELPEAFMEEHGAVVIENHLNMIKPLNGAPKVGSAALSALLNSNVVDQVFRCINGSVAVSAYELEALPLPPPEDLEEIELLVNKQASRPVLERAMGHLYCGSRNDAVADPATGCGSSGTTAGDLSRGDSQPKLCDPGTRRQDGFRHAVCRSSRR